LQDADRPATRATSARDFETISRSSFRSSEFTNKNRQILPVARYKAVTPKFVALRMISGVTSVHQGIIQYRCKPFGGTMRKRGLIIATTWAAATFGIILAIGLPASLDAVNPAVSPKPDIATPTIISNGIALSAVFDRPTTQPSGQPMAISYIIGDKPALQIRAENQSKDRATLDFTVTINETTPPMMMSRRPAMPDTVWSHDDTVTLNPGEQKTITLASDKPLPAAGTFSVLLKAGDSVIVPLSAAVADPKVPISESPALAGAINAVPGNDRPAYSGSTTVTPGTLTIIGPATPPSATQPSANVDANGGTLAVKPL
jgi:hypothetical protein